jgi:serine/threonine protein kinase
MLASWPPGLTEGSRFGPYEIIALVGTGGMGEVYRARDPRLSRVVAIDVRNELAPSSSRI